MRDKNELPNDNLNVYLESFIDPEEGKQQEICSALNEYYSKTRDEILSNSEVSPIPPELELAQDEILKFYKNKLEELGIKQPDKIVTTRQASKKYLNSTFNNIGGYSLKGANLILIDDMGMPFKPDDVPDNYYQLNLRYKAKLLAHELAHSLCYSLAVAHPPLPGSSDKDDTVEIFRDGINYQNDPEGGPYALEEARAQYWAKKAWPIIDELFPSASDEEKKIFDTVPPDRLNDGDVLGWTEEEGYILNNQLSGTNGIALDNYLREKIPDYDLLIERARIMGEIDTFAVIIEEKFGIGFYNKIITVKEEHAAELLKELQNITPNNITKLEDIVPNC